MCTCERGGRAERDRAEEMKENGSGEDERARQEEGVSVGAACVCAKGREGESNIPNCRA